MFWLLIVTAFLLGMVIGTAIGISRGGYWVRKQYNLPSAYEEWLVDSERGKQNDNDD